MGAARQLVSRGLEGLLDASSSSCPPGLVWEGSRSLRPQEAQPFPGPDLHPGPPPHLPAVTMETQALLPCHLGCGRAGPFLWFWRGRVKRKGDMGGGEGQGPLWVKI